MNLGHTYLFHKGFCTVYFWKKDKNAATLPHNAQRKHVFLGKIKQMSKSKKLPPRKKVALKILHQILGQISTISFMSGDTANIWEDIELRIDTEPFCTSCQIYSIKKG